MAPEREDIKEVKMIGNISVERNLNGDITKINKLAIMPGDKLIVVQRHQRPEPFNKEDLLKTAPEGITDLTNLDYKYNPKSNPEGAVAEQKILTACREALGEIDNVVVTPRKRGSEQRDLILQEFPKANHDPEVDQLVDDSGLGLLGESMLGAYEFTADEANEHFKLKKKTGWHLGRGARGEKQGLSYMEAWARLGHLDPKSRWKVESPEELAVRTEKLLDGLDQDKNFILTHEANCVVFHLLSQRDNAEILEVLDGLSLPENIARNLSEGAKDYTSLMQLYQGLKDRLEKPHIKGFGFRTVLTQLLENIRVKSGTKGYGALSVYALRETDQGQKELLEAAYDEQV